MKKKKDSGAIGIKEAFSLQIRALKLWMKAYPETYILETINAIYSALNPYVGVYLSALLINELAGPRRREELIRLVIITLVTEAVIRIIWSIIGKISSVKSTGMYQAEERFYAQKYMSMDYSDCENTEIIQTLQEIHNYQNWMGWGLSRTQSYYKRFLELSFSIIGAAVMTITLFTSRTTNPAYRFLDNPLIILGAVVVIMLIKLLEPVLHNKAQQVWANCGSDMTFANRKFTFYGWRITENSRTLDVRMFRQDKKTEEITDNFASVWMDSSSGKALNTAGLISASASITGALFTIILYVFVAMKAWAGAFGVGSVTQYISTVSSFSGGIGGLVSLLGDIKNNAPHLKRAFSYLDIPNRMYRGSLTTEKRRDKKYEIEFRDVSFKYPSTETYALRHLNFRFTIGSKLAIVGENGSGKTTFIKLLCRLYDPTEGEILLNGINIKKYNYKDYMDIFSVVFQDYSLLAMPLGENVAASSTYDREKAQQCLIEAGFGEKLADMPDGLDTQLYKDSTSKGVNISGGEAQKIAIARSLYRDAAFIMLDEPTAALDPIAESEIYSKFNEIVGDKTAIYISHRLSSCRFCDKIAVFDHGAVVEEGSHDELVSKEGKYQSLWNAQAQYYDKEKEEAQRDF